MKQFLLKHKGTILYWVIFLFILLVFTPRQSDYYLDNDIKDFKKEVLTPALFWTWVTLSVILLVILFIWAVSYKAVFRSFFYISVMTGLHLFIFNNILLAGALFINRQYKRETLQRIYVASFFPGAEKTKDNFYPYDVLAKNTTSDKKLRSKIYRADLQTGDTIYLTFDKGLLGVAFPSTPSAKE